jgi:hypothetical protein
MDTQNTQNTPSQSTQLPAGTQVRVSNFEPRPPERFNKKLSTWKHSNYTGVIVAFEHGGYTVQRKPDSGWRPNDYCIFFQSGTRPDRVIAIPGACLAPLKGDGVSVQVDVSALLAIEAAATQQHAAA